MAVAKSILFVVVTITPFYVFGRIFAVCYQMNSENAGKLYAADLTGAALACFLVPLMFRTLPLPGVLGLLFLSLSIFVCFFAWKNLRPTRTIEVLVVLNAVFLLTIFYIEESVNLSDYFPGQNDRTIREVAHDWNELSRVSVVRATRGKGRAYYRILHDNAVSTVHVKPYRRGAGPHEAKRFTSLEVPFLMERNVGEVLVMFAGCGAEMIGFDEFAQGRTRITGVELNPLVKSLALETPELKNFRLADFYDLPHITFRIQEGRSFLASDEGRYDVIFIGSKAGTTAQMTAHSRKFLDTEEAYQLYFDHLTEHGVLVLDHQSIRPPIQTLKRIFGRQPDYVPFEEAAVIIKDANGHNLVVSPSGFTRIELAKLVRAEFHGRNRLVYMPYRKNPDNKASRMMQADLEKGARVTDDRPFEFDIDFARYTLCKRRTKSAAGGGVKV